MRVRLMLAVALAVAGTGATAAPVAAAAHTTSWRPVMLRLPHGHPDATGTVAGTDGHGTYAGTLRLGGAMDVVTWRHRKPRVRGVPAGCTDAQVVDMNSAGVVVGEASGCPSGVQGFVLDGGGFHALQAPDDLPGYVIVKAINDRGDVLGLVDDDDDFNTTGVLWPGGGGPATVFPPSGQGEIVQDLDDDGTILFGTTAAIGSYVWRDGVKTPLANPPDYAFGDAVYPQAISNGRVVGLLATGNGNTGVLWRRPDDPVMVPGSTVAADVNATGLVLGQLPRPLTSLGPPALWQETTPLGTLPTPPGYTDVGASAVSDGGEVLGHAYNGDTFSEGAPVVWRRH
ncbi:MAG: hypothetical protein J2P14_02115 [Acidothermales bacterium]|nr:hypothetical protein [Acidothermales bacterium]